MQLIRHATLILHYGGRTLLVDPMLSAPGVHAADQQLAESASQSARAVADRRPKRSWPASTASSSRARIPITWDPAAVALVPKGTPLVIQPHDAKRMVEQGFTAAQTVDASITWNGITIARTGGQHGRGEVGKRLAPVSGFVLKATGAPTIYLARRHGLVSRSRERASAVHAP